MRHYTETLTPGGGKSSKSGSRMLPPPGMPLPMPPGPPPLPGSGPPGNGPRPGPTGSNLAPGGAPIGGRKPSPPHGPIPPGPGPRIPAPKMGWLGPTNIPSPPLSGKSGGGAKGLLGNGSRSRRPISRGLRGDGYPKGARREGMAAPPDEVEQGELLVPVPAVGLDLRWSP